MSDEALGGAIGAAALRRLLALRGRRLDLGEVEQALKQEGEPRFAGGRDALAALSAALGRLGAGGIRMATTQADMLTEVHLPALVEIDGRSWVMKEIRGSRRLLDPGEGNSVEMDVTALERANAIWFDHEGKPQPRKGDSPALAMLWAAFARRKRVFVEVAIGTILTSTLAIASSFFALQVYDRVIPTFAYATLYALAGVVGVIIFFDFILRIVRARLLDRVSRDIDEELSVDVFRSLAGIRLDARPKSVGSLAAQVAGLEISRSFFASGVLFTLAELPFAVMFIVLIGFIGGPIALIYTAAAIIALLWALVTFFRLRAISNRQMELGFARNGLLVESIHGAETIKANNAGWRFSDRWRDATVEIAKLSLSSRSYMSGATTLTQSLTTIAYVCVIIMGVNLIEAGSLTMGGLIACSMLGGRVIAPIGSAVGLIVQAQQATQAMRAVDGILVLPKEREPGVELLSPSGLGHDLGAEGMRFFYSNIPVPQVDMPALRIEAGERMVLVGAPGSGKSTLLRLLSGLYRPSGGRVTLGGVDIALLDPELVRRQIGFLPQEVQLFRGTLRENLNLNQTVSDDALVAVVQELGLDALVRDHPKGLDREISEGGSGLSGGQRQLVGIARVILSQPRVWLLDEPTAGLDRAHEARALAALERAVAPDDTLVIATHRPAAIAFARRIAIIQRGRVVKDGDRDAVLAALRASGDQRGVAVVA
jgi:ATP-binding cassette subfamily C protein LapB